MDMNNVKAITLPNGGKVKKIKNNNGQTIWADDTKYPYRKLEWIKFTGDQYCGIGRTWELAKAYVIYAIRNATDPNIEGSLASNNNNYDAGGWICNIKHNSNGSYFTYKAGSATSPNYVLNDYFPNNSKRIFRTYLSKNLIVLDVMGANGSILGNDEFTIQGGTWPGSSEILIGYKLKGVKIESIKISNASVSSGSTINIGATKSRIWPCQRKSDGKVGFYITSDNTFHPLSGTVTSDNIGPTADEYPDIMSINS